MSKYNEVIEELKKTAEQYKKVTNARLEEANYVVDSVIDIIKEAGLDGENDIRLLDNNGLGLRYKGAQNIGYFLYLVETDTNTVLPKDIEDIDSKTFIGGNFAAPITYMNTENTLEAIKKIPSWIDGVKAKIEEIAIKYAEAQQEQNAPTAND